MTRSNHLYKPLFVFLSLLIGLPSYGAILPVPLPQWNAPSGPNTWSFSSPDSVRVEQAEDSTYLIVKNKPETANGTAGATLHLPLRAFEGNLLVISIDIRAIDVSKPPHPYLGIKAMVHVTSSSASDTWDQAAANGNGTFPIDYDWTRITFQTHVPADSISADLFLGLQGSSGEVDFRNLTVNTIRPSRRTIARSGPVFTGHNDGALRGVMISPDILPSDVATLASWNVNLVRWQINDTAYPEPMANTEDAQHYDAWLDKSLAHLDQLLPYFKKAGILVALDLHTSPGGSDTSGINRVFTNINWQRHFVEQWQKIAKRYRDERQIWGYDLLNEPGTPGLGTGLITWHDLAQTTANKIRKIDAKHAIIVEPDPGGSVDELQYFDPIDTAGVVYEVHMYDPGGFTFQGVNDDAAAMISYPGTIGGQLWNRDRIEKEFQSVADFAARNNVHIYVGEFSAARWVPGADRYLADVISVLEEHHWDWSYHAFREWQGWSLEIGDDKTITTPSPTPTARLLVLKAAFAKNKPQVP